MRVTWPIMIRRVKGHSMVPILPPGTIVLGWRWFMRLKPEKVIIFVHHNRETVKRIDHVSPNGLFVVGDHAESSTDSRHFGTISWNSVEAKVFWPRTHKMLAEDFRQ